MSGAGAGGLQAAACPWRWQGRLRQRALRAHQLVARQHGLQLQALVIADEGWHDGLFHQLAPGTTNIAHMEENLGVAAITFTGDELHQSNSAVAAVRIQGERLPAAVACRAWRRCRSAEKPGGIGEPAVALGNAIFAATGKRAWRTPFTSEYLAKA